VPAYGAGQWVREQFWQAAPPVPHAVFEVPAAQLLALEQHPVQPESVLQVQAWF
jgi:hypothetical protein